MLTVQVLYTTCLSRTGLASTPVVRLRRNVWFAVALLTVCAAARAQDPGQRPIAFVSERDGNSEIYVINPDGSGLRNLSQHPADDTLPKWSPDGSRIAFLSDRDTDDTYVEGRFRNRRLVVMTAEGGGATVLAPAAHDFAWSPSGDRIAYSYSAYTPNPVTWSDELWIAAADGSTMERLGEGIRMAWSPDGTRLAATSKLDWFRDVGHGTLDQVTVWDTITGSQCNAHAVPGSYGWGHVTMFAPLWMPDAAGLVVTWEKTTSIGNLLDSGALFVTPDGHEATDLSVRPSEAVSVSPDGAAILFTPVSQTSEAIYGAPFVTDLRGANRRVLGDEPVWTEKPRTPSWAPDSNSVVMGIAYGWEEPSDLYTVTLDGTPPVRLTHDGGDQPDWQRDPAPFPTQLPSLGIVSPPEDHALPADARTVRLAIQRHGYDGAWQWKLNGSFPARGQGGGTTVEAGASVTINGLERGRLYTVSVAPVDAAGHVLTPHFRVQRRFSVASPEPSPDLGRTWIAFQGGSSMDESYIYRMRPDGSELTQVTHGDARDARPAWAPDGTRVAFHSGSPGAGQSIMVIDADGTGRRQVTPDDILAAAPDWSPDGRTIAFAGGVSGEPTQIYVIDVDGSGLRQLTDSGRYAREPAWSPGGRRIAYTLGWWGDSDIHIVDADGGPSSLLWGSLPSAEFSPEWSPDGRSLLFGIESNGLYLADLEAGYDVKLWGGDTLGSWAPDASMISVGSGGIYTLRSDGSNGQFLMQHFSTYSAPDWGPFVAPKPTTRETVSTQIRGRLERYVFPPALLGLAGDGTAIDLRAAGRSLRASDLVRVGASLCVELDGGPSRGVVGRDGRVVAGSDFAIAEGVPYAISASVPIAVTLGADAAWPTPTEEAQPWVFAAVARVPGGAGVAPDIRLRVTNSHTGATIVAEQRLERVYIDRCKRPWLI